MNLNRILCPVDFSPYSQAANYYASMFADGCRAEIIYLACAWPPTKDDIETRLDDLYAELTLRVRPLLPDVRHVFEVRAGDPAKEIVKFASERNVDLIVMGTHGRTGPGLLMYGSVCQKVLRRSLCPVMAVKMSLNPKWLLPPTADATESTGESSTFSGPS